MKSSTPTNSASVELFVFSFCLLEPLMTAPLPMIITPPVWLFISGCTAYEASTNQWSDATLLHSSVRCSSFVLRRYRTTRRSLYRSSRVGQLTRVHKNDMAVSISGRALIDRNNSLAVRVWNSSAVSLSSLGFDLSSHTTNRLLAAGVAAYTRAR